MTGTSINYIYNINYTFDNDISIIHSESSRKSNKFFFIYLNSDDDDLDFLVEKHEICSRTTATFYFDMFVPTSRNLDFSVDAARKSRSTSRVQPFLTYIYVMNILKAFGIAALKLVWFREREELLQVQALIETTVK